MDTQVSARETKVSNLIKTSLLCHMSVTKYVLL